MLLVRIFTALLALALFCCDKQEAETHPGNAAVTDAAPPEAAPSPFQPPVDGLLKPGQVKKFLLAHQALLKINEMYLDRLDGASAENRRAILGAMDLARDKAARKFGLNGYAEYRWILEDAPRNPENVRLLQQMRVSVVGGS
jgi:hypothetical protein